MWLFHIYVYTNTHTSAKYSLKYIEKLSRKCRVTLYASIIYTTQIFYIRAVEWCISCNGNPTY